MSKDSICLMLVVLVLGLPYSGWGTTNIIIVTNNPGDEADYTPFLKSILGYDITVEAEDDKYIDPLGAAAKADLSAADLIIVSRRTSSGNFDAEIEFWNGLATPIILHSAFLIGDSRWRWMRGGNENVDMTHVGVVARNDPIFNGVTIVGDQVKIFSSLVKGLDVSNQDSAGNGTKIATPAGSGKVMVARWDAGIEYYSGSGQITGGPRIFFGMRTDEFFPFVTDDGKKMLENAVRYLLGGFLDLGSASNPKPANEETDVPRDVVLCWTAGKYAPAINGHKVYLSSDFNNVKNGVGGISVDANSYAPPQRLDFGTTYYWRVDEVNGPPDYTVYKGDLWSFTTELFSYPVENITATASSVLQADTGPENTVNGSGLDANDLHSIEKTDMWVSSAAGPQPTWIQYEFDKVYKLHQMWVWNFNQDFESLVGFGLKDVTIEHSTNGTDWTTLNGVPEFARAQGAYGYAHNTTVDFGGTAARYVRLTANSNWGGILNQYGLSEVRFLYIPVSARKPNPASGATDVDLDVVLSFRAGREAATHDVYFGKSIPPPFIGKQAQNSYEPGPLELSTTYYWRIDESNEAQTPATWEGDLWSFTTRQFLIVDDFESYNDFDTTDPASNRIFNTWIDGYGVPTNGSIVGYDGPPFAERTIVHGGKQSMPLFYNNTAGKAYSEAECTFAVGQDWTKAGSRTLVLFFYGTAGNTGQLYAKVNGSKAAYGGNAGDIAIPQWKQWNIDLAALNVNLQNVTKLSIGIDGNGASGKLYFDDIRLYRLAP